jgi:hypothetical protein
VRMPVKDGKQANRAHGPGERRVDAECNSAPSTITDSAMPVSTNGIEIPTTPRTPPSAITPTKVNGHEPQRTPAELIGKQAYHHHSELMVEAREWVHETVHEPGCVAVCRMSERKQLE